MNEIKDIYVTKLSEDLLPKSVIFTEQDTLPKSGIFTEKDTSIGADIQCYNSTLPLKSHISS